MSSRTQRATILAFSNLLNFSVRFLSPILLVRILDQESYGQYKEFYLYAGLFEAILDFSIRNNLLYFIAKNPLKEKEYITNTVFFKLVLIFVGVLFIYIFQGQILEATTYDFIYPLILYLIVAIPFNYVDIYWLTQKRSDLVLYYSLSIALFRLLIILIVAYFTQNLMKIIYSIVIVHTIITLFNIYYFLSNKKIMLKVDFNLLKEQVIYILPLGFAGLVMILNRDISKIMITNYLGASALALYAVASQRLPITNVIRSSVTNVIFPDMAELVNKNPIKALGIWNRSTTIYFFLMLPLFFLMFYYSNFFITFLFTKDYIEAVPVFQIYLIFFIKQSFDMGPPIRAKNKNKFLLVGHLISFFVNVALLYSLYNLLGFVGPALAFVITEILLTLYFGVKIIQLYNIEVANFLSWKKLFQILLVGLFLTPLLYLADLIFEQNIITVLVSSLLYGLLYIVIVSKLKIDEVNNMFSKLSKKFPFLKSFL